MLKRLLQRGAASRTPLLGGRLVLVLLIAILAYQVLLPLLLIVWTSLKVVRPGEPGFLDFSFSFANYARAYGIKEFWQSSLNTLYFASGIDDRVVCLGNFSGLDRRAHQHTLGAHHRHDYLGPHYYPGRDYYNFLDLACQSEHRRIELI